MIVMTTVGNDNGSNENDSIDKSINDNGSNDKGYYNGLFSHLETQQNN